MKPKLMYVISEDGIFCSHFLERAVAAQAAGYDVAVVTHERAHGAQIRAAGLRLLAVNLNRRGIKPVAAFVLLLKIWRIYRRERPDVLHHVGARPIFLGALAARLVGRRPAIVNAPMDMGADADHVLASQRFMARLLRPCVRLACRLLLNPRDSRVLFENPDDAAWFVDRGVVRPADAVVIRGAGIDVRKFHPPPASGGVPVVALAGPMRRDKGIHDFIEAAHYLHDAGIAARFVLVGAPDPEDPASIPFDQLRAWHGKKGVEWWGWLEEMTLNWRDVDIACQPSRRESFPRNLLEAAASGLPVVATDAAGCREIVKNGDNGLLVPVGNVPALAKALCILIADADLRRRMGCQGRVKAEREFSSEQVIAETLAVYRTLHSCRCDESQSNRQNGPGH